MKVLVTGASGFIGTNFFQFLAREQDAAGIWLFDKHYGQDIRDYDQLRQAVEGMDLVVNFAASTHVDNSIPNPLPFFWNNAEGVVQVLRAVTDEGCKLIHISSSEVYGSIAPGYIDSHTERYIFAPTSGNLRVDERGNFSSPDDYDVFYGQAEDHPINPQSPYAAAKAAGDRACYAWWQTYNTDVVIVRPFNQYGPYQAAEKAIPFFIDLAINGKPLPVYGQGLASRDWLYVQDTVSGIWAARNAPAGEVYNLATGKDYTLVELTQIIRDVLGVKGYTVHTVATADRPGHVQRLLGDARKAHRELNWSAQVELPDGVLKTAEWLISNGKIVSPFSVDLRNSKPSWVK
jgi:dTDP-glucose 4,6-dehydratase